MIPILPSLRTLTALAASSLIVSTQAQVPDGPANVVARILPAEVFFTWDTVPGATFYQVFRGGLDRNWVPLQPVSATTYHDGDYTDLPSYYRIAAFGPAGLLTATPDLLITNATVNLVVMHHVVRPLSDTSVAIGWVLGSDADGVLEVGVTGGASEEPFYVAIEPGFKTAHEFVVGNLTPGTTYWYRLISANTNRGGTIYRNIFTQQAYVAPPPIDLELDPFYLPTVRIPDDALTPLALRSSLPSGPATEFLITIPPNSGTLHGTPPLVTYQPTTLSDRGTETRFTVRSSNGIETSDKQVRVIVNPTYNGPHAQDQSITVHEDTLSSFSVGRITAQQYVVVGPTNGTLFPSNAVQAPQQMLLQLQYLPGTNFTGVDHFQFRTWDFLGTGNIATVRLRVLPVPDPPIAHPQFIALNQDTIATITAQISDPDGEAPAVTLDSSPAHGAAWLSGDQTFSYQPAPGYFGPDSFTYNYSDGTFSGTATIYLTVLRVNHPPIAQPRYLTTDFETPIPVTLAGTDQDGDALSFQMVTLPASGTITGSAPQLTYTPGTGFSGIDSLVYRVSDGQLDSPLATVTLTVLPPAPPAAPTGLAAFALSRTEIHLGWNDNSRTEDGFEIERASDNKPLKLLTTVGRDVRTFADTGVMKNKTYSYRIRAVNRFGASAYTYVVSATTPR